jgi:chromosome segregation ATPase
MVTYYEREKTMKKLTIEINGLEYVAKDNLNNDLELKRLRELNEIKDNEINELEHDVGLLSMVEEENSIKINSLVARIEKLEDSLSEKEEEINGLQTYIDELEDEAGNMFSKYNELAQAINRIESITKGLI